jgi:hypothetical protein
MIMFFHSLGWSLARDNNATHEVAFPPKHEVGTADCLMSEPQLLTCGSAVNASSAALLLYMHESGLFHPSLYAGLSQRFVSPDEVFDSALQHKDSCLPKFQKTKTWTKLLRVKIFVEGVFQFDSVGNFR